MDIPLGFNHLSMDRHVGFFHFLDRMNYAAMNMYKFLCGPILSFFLEREYECGGGEAEREGKEESFFLIFIFKFYFIYFVN